MFWEVVVEVEHQSVLLEAGEVVVEEQQSVPLVVEVEVAVEEEHLDVL